MATLKVVLAGLFASTAFASPWNRKKDHDDAWKEHHGHHVKSWGPGEGPPGYGPSGYDTSSAGAGWGYGSTSVCLASTVTETLQPSPSTVYVTRPASTVTLSHATTITLPASVSTSIYTVLQSASCSQVAPVTECASTVTETSTSYLTRTAPGYNSTATETSIVTAPGTTLTEYR